jgi:arsenite/tail-anchored protein-transporting ATPase
MTFLSELASRRVVLFGGKGGVGKTTISAKAARAYAATRPVVLFTTDPASSLDDLFRENPPPEGLTLESLHADALYRRFLDTNLPNLLEIGDRGTYLDRDELRRFFELSLPGIDEIMAWMRIGELAETRPEAMIVVDTAPTGHTLRMLSSAGHFRQVAEALDAMQEKHRAMVRQFTRRDVRDAVDAYITDFAGQAQRRRELLTDPEQTAFVPVFLSEPWVVEQTVRLIEEVRAEGIDVPVAVLNRAVLAVDCELDVVRQGRDAEARSRVAVPVVDVARFCEGSAVDVPVVLADVHGGTVPHTRLTFLAGKGGVGKTSLSASIALQLALANPTRRYTVISVDPAHSLRDVFAHESPPPNLTVETIDTRAKWSRFRQSLGGEIERAVDAITPRGMTLAHDTEAMQRLIEVAPPGADELFAISRLADLAVDATQDAVIVDTAPTGHFLRLLDLPRTAGEWVRELMRILLNYRDLLPPGSLGEELVSASRSLKELEAVLHSADTSVVIVTRPERVIVDETRLLRAAVEERGLRVGGVVANYVTPANACACDQRARSAELGVLAALGEVTVIERRDAPVTTLADLATLVDIQQAP